MAIDLHAVPHGPRDDQYLVSPGAAWFAFAMTVALMIFDYVDRQVIVSLFPHLKAEWNLSDKQLGSLVSIVSITVAIGGIPVALFADRVSRVKSIVGMAGAWSLATISCMFAPGYGALFAARAVVGLGEAGYGSVGAGLIASHFPARMRGTLMAGFFSSMSLLRQAGLIDSVRGRSGGYRLAKLPRRSAWARCSWSWASRCSTSRATARSTPGQAEDGICVHHGGCSLRALWQTLEQWMRGTLDQITLADLLQNEGRIAELLRARLATTVFEDAATLVPLDVSDASRHRASNDADGMEMIMSTATSTIQELANREYK